MEAVDLGKLYKINVRHDNSMINPAWFLDKIEVVDLESDETFTFHCERWLAKGKDDGKISRYSLLLLNRLLIFHMPSLFL